MDRCIQEAEQIRKKKHSLENKENHEELLSDISHLVRQSP